VRLLLLSRVRMAVPLVQVMGMLVTMVVLVAVLGVVIVPSCPMAVIPPRAQEA
jgi:hypothetical protein